MMKTFFPQNVASEAFTVKQQKVEEEERERERRKELI